MNVQPFNIKPEVAARALRTYKANRGVYDRYDWEIERIYRQISKGNKVISAFESIRAAGIDDLGRPRLALMRADQHMVICDAYNSSGVTFRASYMSRAKEWYFAIPWPNRSKTNTTHLTAQLPRIPPQHRPAKNIADYHLLWEADWSSVPRDPILLKRIALDAWIVLAAWDLTEVELSVMRTRP